MSGVPLAIAASAIVITQVPCAWWITSSIATAINHADNAGTLESMDKTLDSISSSVDDIATVAKNSR